MATLKPTTPLLTPNTRPLKPASPLRPKTAPKTPFSRPQRRWRFQSHTGTSEQRRSRFQTTGPPGRQGLAGVPVGGGGARPSNTQRQAAPVWRAPEGLEGSGCGARGRWRGQAGLRDDAPSEARGADGSRAGRHPRAHRAARPTGQHIRRPEHQRGHKQPGTPAGPQATRNTGPHTARGPKRRSASGPTLVSVAHRLSWM